MASAAIVSEKWRHLLKKYISGGVLSWTSSNSVTVSDIFCRDSTDTVDIDMTSKVAAITTSGAGGLDTGAEATSTLYYVFTIAKLDGTTNTLISLSQASPIMPTGYIY